MKFIFVLAALLVTSSAMAYDLKHMVNLTSTASSFSYSESGGSGSAKSYSHSFYFSGDYAYAISDRFQLAGRGTYQKNDSQGSDFEYYSLNVGGIYNLDDNLANAFYLSAFAGFGWSNNYGRFNNHSENVRGELSFGKRFELGKWKLTSVSYSPSIDYIRSENNIGSAYYTNTVVIRLIQISAFF